MSMADQNQATNPPQGPNVPADKASVADPAISAYPRRRSYKRWIRIYRRCAGRRPSLPCQCSHFGIYPEGQR
jgi:hypothetical protein